MAALSSSEAGIAAVAHIAGFATSILGPLLIYLLVDDEFAKQNAANALNWQIMVLLYMTVAGILAFLVIGFVLIPVVLLLNLVFCLMATVKAINGETWPYPLTIELVSNIEPSSRSLS